MSKLVNLLRTLPQLAQRLARSIDRNIGLPSIKCLLPMLSFQTFQKSFQMLVFQAFCSNLLPKFSKELKYK